jgi:hypothetical protein
VQTGGVVVVVVVVVVVGSCVVVVVVVVVGSCVVVVVVVVVGTQFPAPSQAFVPVQKPPWNPNGRGGKTQMQISPSSQAAPWRSRQRSKVQGLPSPQSLLAVHWLA